MARASSWNSALRNLRFTARNCSGETRVASTLWPGCASRAKISANCRGVFPGPKMVHVGEAEVLEGKMPQPLHRLLGRELAALHLLEQLLDGVGSHGAVVSCQEKSFEFLVSSFKFRDSRCKSPTEERSGPIRLSPEAQHVSGTM